MSRFARPLNSLALVVVAAAISVGCRSLQLCSAHLPVQGYAPPQASHANAAAALASGDALCAAGKDECVDEYYCACLLSSSASCAQSSPSPAPSIAVYNDALAKLIGAAVRFGRIESGRGILVRQGNASFSVPVTLHGFPWRSSDFQCFWPPPKGHEKLLTRRYECSGIGCPLVVGRCRNDANEIESRFFPDKSFFAATALLRFPSVKDDEYLDLSNGQAAVLEFYNPLLLSHYEDEANGSQPLAKNLTASLAVTLENAPRTYFAGFVEPGGAETKARLQFLEPYQPGKVPVVLIHGLFSDPLGWADLINDLRAAPGFAERFQIWVFRYPTGQGFLQSAASLRTELRAAINALDPSEADNALKQMVLVGHSMGGLIAKLQVAYSEELIWSRLANRPLEEIITTPSTRAFLMDVCYFNPSPNVRRVIFIASPHCGSTRSGSVVGRGASLLVQPAPQQTAIHEQLVRDNPSTFNPQIERRFPTSIDMLSPDSPLLDAMHQMRLSTGMALHNIIAVSHPISLDGPSDGVVSVHSASHPNCKSVLAINAPHAKAHRSLQASYEILRILACQTTETLSVRHVLLSREQSTD